MAKGFRDYSLDQAYLLPQEPRQWLSKGHLALFFGRDGGDAGVEEDHPALPEGPGPPGLPPPGCCSPCCSTATAAGFTAPGR